jgi:hypothetical protein
LALLGGQRVSSAKGQGAASGRARPMPAGCCPHMIVALACSSVHPALLFLHFHD